MGNRHLVVISVDALVYEDIADTSELPLYDEIIRGGSLTKNVLTVFPSLTHTVHASIVTGQPAGVTGIISNTVFTPGTDDMPWYNRLSEIKCESIFDLAHAAGVVTAVCHWPVTAGAGDKIDFLIPELMKKDLEEADGDIVRGYLNIGMSECLKDILEKAIKEREDKLRRESGTALTKDKNAFLFLEHPEYDEIQTDCACEILRRYKPGLLLTHPGYVDGERHRTGLFSPSVKAAVRKSEEWIGKLMQAAKDAGIYEDTDFVILSDHGHMSYSKEVRLNRLLVDEGLIKLDPEGGILDWDVYAQSCDLSALIYLKRPEDEDLQRRCRDVLDRWQKQENAPAASVMDAREAEKEYGLKGDFSFVVEAAEGICFSDEWKGDAVCDATEGGRQSHSAHGHRPEKGPQPVFIGFGPDFPAGKIKDGGNILEHYNVFRKILGI